MSDFDALQRAVEASAHARRSETRQCETLLTALYQALRQASGPGLPLNNVAMEPLHDPAQRLRPMPLGSFHAAWFRLGLCEVLVRVRRDGSGYLGEYGLNAQFRLAVGSDAETQALARELLRTLTQLYADQPPEKWTN
ncbi:hypothetical protein [Deinococcus sp.]|uniref:hypothetical protein n=1 Tax=Deinococcus sp. TaxID=47478 RepID=UPI003B5C8F51